MQYSYGILPFFRAKAGFLVLLVQHVGGHWSFPKGHIESQETPLQTAKREVFEEVGLAQIDVLPNVYFDHYYSFFEKGGVLVNKRVGFFVGEVYDTTVVLQKSELQDFCWKTVDDAMEILTFESDKNILKRSYEAIKALRH